MPGCIKLLAGLAIASTLASACTDTAAPITRRPADAPALAKGGNGGGGNPVPTPARCATITVTNNGQSVRRSVMPDVKYSLENCGTDPVTVTITVTETAGFLSELCPSPVAPPVVISLGAKQKLSGTTPVFRGTCGMSSNVNGVLVQGINAWQGHNLLLTVTDNADGTSFGGAAFSWQDILNPGI